MIECRDLGNTSGDWSAMQECLQKAFSDENVLSASFEMRSASAMDTEEVNGGGGGVSSSNDLFIDSEAIDACFNVIGECHKNEELWALISTASIQTVKTLNGKQDSSLRAMLMLMHNPYMLNGVTPVEQVNQ